MTKKTFALKSHLSKGEKWVIDYEITWFDSKTTDRHRKSFGINDIEDHHEREIAAKAIMKALPDLIFVREVEVDRVVKSNEPAETVLQAAWECYEVGKTDRITGNQSYKTAVNHLERWLVSLKKKQMRLIELDTKWAYKFKSYLVGLGNVGPASRNNIIANLGTLWNRLDKIGIKWPNPWTDLGSERAVPEKHQPIPDDVRRIVVREVEAMNYWVYRALLLLYYCGIRSTELCRLKFSDINLTTGVIHVSARASKSYKDGHATIPASIMHHFKDGIFDKYPGRFYILGVNWTPNPDKPLYHTTVSRRHALILDSLVREGKLTPDQRAGVKYYDWKHTGVTKNIKVTSPLATKDQMRHTDLNTTMLYYKASPINKEYQDLPDTLHE